LSLLSCVNTVLEGIKRIMSRYKRDTEGHERVANQPVSHAQDITHKVVSIDQQRAQSGTTAIDVLRSRRSFDTEIARLETAPDLVCLSHLRWDFVYQRPQHLLSRCAKTRRVFFIEEPVIDDGPLRLDVTRRENSVYVAVPHIPYAMLNDVAVEAVQQGLIDRFFVEQDIKDYILWYYTPMALGFTHHLDPVATVYDCMDELSAFKNAPATLRAREAELFKRADLVFTGGQSLYEAKRDQHHSVHAFPSSIDAAHFSAARSIKVDPVDQQEIPHPRIGFFGVIDERMDLKLVEGVADARPDWHLVMIGPVVKIEESDLPRRPNIHYLGGKSYKELPAYLAGWDAAILPFALNESTRFISPTKTPEYLSAGCPVVSTSIRDIVRPYGQKGLVHIADTVEEFVSALETAMKTNSPRRLMMVDDFLKEMSWDRTWSQMNSLIEDVIATAENGEAPGKAAGSKQRAMAAGK
jgi:UDP-galactopyranose mutase